METARWKNPAPEKKHARNFRRRLQMYRQVGCTGYRKKEYRELKGRRNGDAFCYEWNRGQEWGGRETEIERGGQTASELQQGGRRGERRRTEGIVKEALQTRGWEEVSKEKRNGGAMKGGSNAGMERLLRKQ